MKQDKLLEINPMGECALIVKFNNKININTHLKIKTLSQYLDKNPVKGMIEYVPAFVTITIFYNPLEVIKEAQGYEQLKNKSPYELISSKIEKIVYKLEDGIQDNPRIVEIPVCYGEEFGPDLKFVADYNKISIEEVIDIHSSCENRVYMIGFAPGFPYLAGMSEKIATPRRKTPRVSIPAGSVGIAGSQTGVYPISTPGGWQLIGKTPLNLFRPENEVPSLLQAGDVVKFRAISKEEYYELKYGEQGELKWA